LASVGNSGGKNTTISLNLNPMLDVFSILITFLLMSFSTDPVSHDVNPGVELPESITIVALDEVPTIVVTKTEIFVNEKKLSTITAGDVIESDRSQGAVMPVYQELKKLAEANKRIAASKDPNAKKPGTLTMEMDKGHRFQVAKRIMLSAQQAEFVTFKLMGSKEFN